MKKRLLVAGLGDTGVLVAILLSRYYDITAVSPKPCLVSGQELGTRLTRPRLWQRDYLVPYRRYRGLDRVEILQGLVTDLKPSANTATISMLDGTTREQDYDALLIATGTSNGFWRTNHLEDKASIEQSITEQSSLLEQANNIAIVGGGATGVSSALNLARQYPGKTVNLFFSQTQPLPGYHPKTRAAISKQLALAGVKLHPDYRAVIPQGFLCDRMTHDPIHWSTGQAPYHADLTLWATGQVRANNQFIPASMLNEQGFVKTDEHLQVEGYPNIFCIGDIAATDPYRSSARNWGWKLVARNIRAFLDQQPTALEAYSAAPFRWGSVVGVQPEGLEVFQPDGGRFRFPPWAVRLILFPVIVRKFMYRGMRRP